MFAYPIIHGHRRRRWRPAPAQAWTAPDVEEAVRALYPDPRTTIVVDDELPAGKFYVVPYLPALPAPTMRGRQHAA